MCDLLDADRFREKLERVILEKNAISHATYGHPLETAGLLEQYLELAAHMRGLVIDTTELLNDGARQRRIGALRRRAGNDARY